MQVNLILKNASIYTVDKDQGWAQAIAIADDKIVFVGSNADVDDYIESDTVVIDLDGKLVLPGFIDSHAHPSLTTDLVSNISLYGLDSLAAYQAAIANFVKHHPNREFFRGSGWADTLFPNIGPSKRILDKLIPDRPVALISYDGHSMWVNSVTLEKAGISKDTLDPEGGRIERDPDTGEPSGVLRETAFKLIEKVIPNYSLEELKNGLLAYQDMAIRAGITMVHDAMLDAGCIGAFNALAEEGKLNMRFRGSITLDPDKEIEQQIETVLTERSKNTHPLLQLNFLPA